MTDAYLDRCRGALETGQPIPQPISLPELRMSLLHFPTESAGYRPSADTLSEVRLPADWCLPYDAHKCDRLIATIRQSAEVRGALRDAFREVPDA
jgi:hypothetical protein